MEFHVKYCVEFPWRFQEIPWKRRVIACSLNAVFICFPTWHENYMEYFDMGCHGVSIENSTCFFPWNSMGYKTGTAILLDRPEAHMHEQLA